MYEIEIAADSTQPVVFRLYVPEPAQVESFRFHDDSRGNERNAELHSIAAFTEGGAVLPMTFSHGAYSVQSAARPFYIEYKLNLHPSALRPETWPNNHPRSMRWDTYAFITKEAFLSWDRAPEKPARIRVDLPDDWTVYEAGIEEISNEEVVTAEQAHPNALVMGQGLQVAAGQSNDVRLIPAGTLPWPTHELLQSLSAMLRPLRIRNLVDATAVYDFVIARYPGALRFNPLISGRSIGKTSFIHWVGIGSLDWWRVHTAAEIVAATIEQSLNLAPDAAWFRAGLMDYAGLLLLYEEGLFDVDAMYQHLHNMFVTGARYAGRSWPSLLMAGGASGDNHAAERVLQFRAPVAVFLFDLELRGRSAGAVTVLDWWAELAASQREQPERQWHTEDLVPPLQRFGDLSSFMRQHVFEATPTPIDFDMAFERWLATQR